MRSETLLPKLSFLAASCALIAGCGTSSPGTGCSLAAVLSVSPASASASSSAMAPANQAQFSAGLGEQGVPLGCPVPQVVAAVHPAWMTSDPLDTTVDSSNTSSNGLATCVHATTTPATLTATYSSGAKVLTQTATLNCQ